LVSLGPGNRIITRQPAYGMLSFCPRSPSSVVKGDEGSPELLSASDPRPGGRIRVQRVFLGRHPRLSSDSSIHPSAGIATIESGELRVVELLPMVEYGGRAFRRARQRCPSSMPRPHQFHVHFCNHGVTILFGCSYGSPLRPGMKMYQVVWERDGERIYTCALHAADEADARSRAEARF
jgi:hypothetical protein